MGDGGCSVSERGLNFRAEPSVIGFRFLGRREFGLNGGELGHGAIIAANVRIVYPFVAGVLSILDNDAAKPFIQIDRKCMRLP